MKVYTLLLGGKEVGTFDAENKIGEILIGYIKDKSIDIPLAIVEREVK